MHDAAFAAAGIDARYVLRELDEAEVPAAVEAARGADWLGLGVTAPYKRLVATLVDEIEDDARAIGAVNNVVRTDQGRLVGINTDALGFRAGAELAMEFPLEGANVVLVGAGGAAGAVAHALVEAGVARVTVANRTADRAAALVAELPRHGLSRAQAAELGGHDFLKALAEADLAVNATTVGMVDPGATIPVDRLPDWATVFDLVYVPPETPLLRAARERGLKAANGSEMLIAQAAAAFERWTGVAGMAGVMREAVAPLLADPTAPA
jgi:shikimate dehydrogenase